ncbi:MAG: bifunctional 4-hydroxy-2-oxoglutarate aldolase/2-dehydro-3-deoxy-phosphogluconate aldolase [Acidobacteriota bacterium]
MNKAEVLKHIRDTGLIPVVRAESADLAMCAVAALKAGGLDVLEVTMTVPGAIEVIRTLAEEQGADTLIGAGTVLDQETARACIQAGAQFIVSPALNEKTIGFCRDQEVAIFPGALTPTEVLRAWDAGADAVKVFPAGAVGGASYLKALKAPLPHIELIPTGGVSLKTAADFIKAGAMALGVGADLVDPQALREGNSALITERARQFLQIFQVTRDLMLGSLDVKPRASG